MLAGRQAPHDGSGPEFGQFAFELSMRAGGLGGGVVSLLAVGLRGVPLGLGFAAALDLFGKPGFEGTAGRRPACTGTGSRADGAEEDLDDSY